MELDYVGLLLFVVANVLFLLGWSMSSVSLILVANPDYRS